MNIWLSEIWQAWRASLRRPGFLLLAAGVLALGIGSTVAVFTLIDNVLLRPLPYPQPAQLVTMTQNGHRRAVSPRQYQHFGSLAGVRSMGLVKSGATPVNVTGGEKPEQVMALDVDHNLLPTLGMSMHLGRNFNVREDRPHGPKSVILSYGFWQRRYAGNTHVIGRSLSLEGMPHTIIGVLPKDFDLLGGSDLLLPMALSAHSHDAGTNYMWVARLAPGSSIKAVGAELDARLHAMYAQVGGHTGAMAQRMKFGVTSLHSALHERSRQVLAMFMACALFVLLIALVNLANLMVLRALARSHDVAVRAALGASTLRLAWPALAEGLLVGVTGAVVGVGLAALGLVSLQGFIPAQWLGHAGLRLDASAWGMAFIIGLGGALLSAALGLWRGHASTTLDELREGGRNGMNRHSGRLGKALVVTQVALAAILLSGAGLFLHTLHDAARTPLGFSTSGVLTFELAPVKSTYPDVPSVQQLTQRVLDRLRAQPGITAAAAGTNLPVGAQFNMPVRVADGPIHSVQYRGVSPGFFATFEVPISAGRVFARSDTHGAEPVAVVNQAFVHKYFGTHAIGKTLKLVLGGSTVRIVGIVGNTRQFGPLQAPPPILYVPLAQVPTKLMGMIRSAIPLRFAVHVRGTAGSYRNSVHAAVAAIAPTQPIANVRTLTKIAHGTTSDMRLNLLLVGLFAGMALILAAAGLYAVMAVAVAAREREFGVRTAIGASPLQLTKLVLRGGFLQILLGLALGVIATLLMAGIMGDVVEQFADRSPLDPLALGGVCIVLTIVGLLACLLPALRAARVAPMHALRGE